MATEQTASAKDAKIERGLKQCLKFARGAGFEENCFGNAAGQYERKIMRSSALHNKWLNKVENSCGQDYEDDSVSQGKFFNSRLKVVRSVVVKK